MLIDIRQPRHNIHIQFTVYLVFINKFNVNRSLSSVCSLPVCTTKLLQDNNTVEVEDPWSWSKGQYFILPGLFKEVMGVSMATLPLAGPVNTSASYISELTNRKLHCSACCSDSVSQSNIAETQHRVNFSNLLF